MTLIVKLPAELLAHNVVTRKPPVALIAGDAAIPCTPLHRFTVVKPTVPGAWSRR
jgi:hypothetical protein